MTRNIPTRNILRISILGILLASLAASAVSALTVPAGKDFWVTPGTGKTFVTFPDGDVEALCGKPADKDWNHLAVFQGVPPSTGPAYDTVVYRLKDAVFDPTTKEASTPIQVVELNFKSTAPQETPCGKLTWTAKLNGTQGITKMNLYLKSSTGGTFHATLSVKAALDAYDDSANYVGTVYYDFLLPSPDEDTPWSMYGDEFRAGMNESNDCIAVLREKLSTYDVKSSHYYFISDMIAHGRCTKG